MMACVQDKTRDAVATIVVTGDDDDERKIMSFSYQLFRRAKRAL